MNDSPEAILDLANAEPDRALAAGASFLRDHDRGAHERALVYRAMSVANRLLGRYQEAIDLAEKSRDLASQDGDGEGHLLAILAMIGPMAVLGRTGEALELIDANSHLVTTPLLAARSSYQRGVVLMISGDFVNAIPAFESTLPQLRAAHDPVTLRSALQNLGHMWIVTGELAKAGVALNEALDIALERDELPSISGIRHNLGLLAAYQGDILEALRQLTISDEIYMELTGSRAPQHVARCEVLLSAGLFREAHRLAREIAENHRSSDDPEHLADALLVTARAALLAGDAAEAMNTADEAARLYEDRERPSHAVEAHRIVIEARYQSEGASETLFESALGVAERLEADKLMVAAAQARLLAGHIAIDLEAGDDEVARTLEPVSSIESGPIEMRLQGRVARARLCLLKDDRRGADAAARSGLRLIDEYQGVLGATDLRMGLEQQGAELGAIGLSLALETGRPRRLLHWMERTRARALRHRPVIGDRDSGMRDALGRLRQVEAKLREPANRADRRLLRERRRMQEQIRTADRLKRAHSTAPDSFTIDTMMEDLEHRALLEFAFQEGRAIGVLVNRGRARRVDMGDADGIRTEVGRARFAMRRAARLDRPIDRVSLAELDRMLFEGVQLRGEELVLVPPPELMAAPWAALPSLREKIVSVSPSAEMWWRSHRRLRSDGGVVVAAGPDLATAGVEVAEIDELYREAMVFAADSTVEEIRNALSGASVAHIASHATFQVENPMFSSLRLGDGDLNVYDIETLDTPPEVVVLSACDSGYTETRAGDELAGLTSALLSMGTRSVVASVGLVPDSPATSDLMVGFHRGLISGLEPARALAEARSGSRDDPAAFVAAASFVCVGA